MRCIMPTFFPLVLFAVFACTEPVSAAPVTPLRIQDSVGNVRVVCPDYPCMPEPEGTPLAAPFIPYVPLVSSSLRNASSPPPAAPARNTLFADPDEISRAWDRYVPRPTAFTDDDPAWHPALPVMQSGVSAARPQAGHAAQTNAPAGNARPYALPIVGPDTPVLP